VSAARRRAGRLDARRLPKRGPVAGPRRRVS
jgi:hypothetical protein